MSALWRYPRRTDELAWPSAPYDPRRSGERPDNVPLRLAFRCRHKRP